MDWLAEEDAQGGRERREELGLSTPEVQFSSFEDVKSHKRWNEDAAAHYSTKLHEVVIDNGQSKDAGARVAAHEYEHAKQAEEFSGVDVDSCYYDVLEEADLVVYDDRLAEERDHDGFGAGYKKGNLMGQLPRLGYDTGLLASFISGDTQLKEDLRELEQQLEGSEEITKTVRVMGKIAEEEGIDGFPDPEDHQIDYSDDMLETLMEVHKLLQDRKQEDQILRYSEARIHAEIEGSAHFLSDVCNPENPGLYDENESAERARFLREESELYQRMVPGTGQTVGEAAADRVDELFDIKRNLQEHGGMNEKEAVQYILNEVQERKIDYAASQIPEYENLGDIEERLEKARDQS